MDIYEALDKLKQNKRIDRTARRKQLVEKKIAESSDKKPIKKLNESVTEKKPLFTESYETDGFNIIDDLVDRAKLILKENGGDREDAIEKAIDEGLLYYDDILVLAQMYNVIDYSELQDKFYDMLIEDIGRGLDQK